MDERYDNGWALLREDIAKRETRLLLAVAGLISFGPPAGVDLMFGATEAARQWARERQKKERAKGREEERKKIRRRVEALVADNPEAKELQELLDQLTDD